MNDYDTQPDHELLRDLQSILTPEVWSRVARWHDAADALDSISYVVYQSGADDAEALELITKTLQAEGRFP